MASIPPTTERYKMPIKTKSKTEKTRDYLLTVHDRCDSCGGQAYVAVTGEAGELMFCAHHYGKIMDNADGYVRMMAFAKEVVDERERLNAR